MPSAPAWIRCRSSPNASWPPRATAAPLSCFNTPMAKFRIYTHQRLQEWVAEEKGYFAAEGLDYEFGEVERPREFASIQVTESAPEISSGAFESMEQGRACEVSTACHW